MGKAGQVCDEIKAGGVKGIFGIDQIDWGGSGGKVYEVWKCEPCCGSPANPMEAIYCLFCWYCCGPCATSKLFASSLSQECAICPHILLVWFCLPYLAPCIRYNLRKKAGAKGNLCGDFVCIWFLGCCSWLQGLRSVPKSAWDLVPVQVPAVVAPEVKLLV